MTAPLRLLLPLLLLLLLLLLLAPHQPLPCHRRRQTPAIAARLLRYLRSCAAWTARRRTASVLRRGTATAGALTAGRGAHAPSARCL
jgi:hypothetical protein